MAAISTAAMSSFLTNRNPANTISSLLHALTPEFILTMPNPKLVGPCTVMPMETEDDCIRAEWCSTSAVDRHLTSSKFDNPFLWRWVTSRCQYRVGCKRHCRRQPCLFVLTPRPFMCGPQSSPHTNPRTQPANVNTQS